MKLVMSLAVLLGYVVIGTIIAVVSRRLGIRSAHDYFVAGYRLGGFVASMTYAATTYSAFMMVGLVGLTYATGVGALGFELMYLIATLTLLSLFAKKVWKLARDRGWISPAEMIADLYGSRYLALIISIMYLVALIPYISAQVIGIGRMIEGLGGGYVGGILLASFVIFVWTAIAGIWSVATTDTFQGLWMIASALLFISWLYLYLYPSLGISISDALGTLSKSGILGLTKFWSLPTFIAFTTPWLFFAVTNPQVVQRLYMPRDSRSLRFMIMMFAVFGFAYTIIVTVLGLGIRALTELKLLPLIRNRDLVTPVALGLAHPLLSAIVFTSIVAAAVSTADSIILTLASSVARDVLPRYGHRRILTYVVVCLLVVVSSAIALSRPGFIVEMSVLSSTLLLPLAPLTLASWTIPHCISRLCRYSPYISLILGFMIGIVSAITYGPKKVFIQLWIGIPIPCWILIASTIPLAIELLLSTRHRPYH